MPGVVQGIACTECKVHLTLEQHKFELCCVHLYAERKVHLTLEQHKFELFVSICMQIFSVKTYYSTAQSKVG